MTRQVCQSLRSQDQVVPPEYTHQEPLWLPSLRTIGMSARLPINLLRNQVRLAHEQVILPDSNTVANRQKMETTAAVEAAVGLADLRDQDQAPEAVETEAGAAEGIAHSLPFQPGRTCFTVHRLRYHRIAVRFP